MGDVQIYQQCKESGTSRAQPGSGEVMGKENQSRPFVYPRKHHYRRSNELLLTWRYALNRMRDRKDSEDESGSGLGEVETNMDTVGMRWIHLKKRAAVYDATIQSVLLYAFETWPLLQSLEATIRSCDRRMIRHIAGITLLGRIPRDELLQRCGLTDVLKVTSVRRLRWYGHVARRKSTEALGRVFNMEVAGRRPSRRPKKTWINYVEQDLCKINATEVDALDRQSWEQFIKLLTSWPGKDDVKRNSIVKNVVVMILYWNYSEFYRIDSFVM